MTYSEFVATFTNGCNIIFNGINQVASSLMGNYIFITILGLVIVVSLFWLLYDLLFDNLLTSNVDKIIEKEDLYKRYGEFRDMRYQWNIDHMHMNEMEAVNRYQVNKNAYSLVFGKGINKTTNKPPEPDWLGKDIIIQKPSPEEEKELDELLKNF